MQLLCHIFLFIIISINAQHFGTKRNNKLGKTNRPQIINKSGSPQNENNRSSRQIASNESFEVLVPRIAAQFPKTLQESLIDEAWIAFKTKYNKTYRTPEEEHFRREIFIDNTGKIKKFNQNYAEGKATFVQRLNSFGDIFHHEFNTALNGFNRIIDEAKDYLNSLRASSFIESANVPIPDAVDWRTLGAVTSVKSQGLCGGCYAFSAAGALEGHYYRKTGTLTDLSPQNLIDCTKPYGNNGCLGGLMNPAFQYVKDNSGIDTDNFYAYEGMEGMCRYRAEGFGADATGFTMIPSGNEGALKVAVATIGPVSAAIDASQDAFQFYSNGVYFDPECKNRTEDMNHAILVVGYGTEADGTEFWMVKNSYGTEWGIGGYIKMARNVNNHCGIANIASYPLV